MLTSTLFSLSRSLCADPSPFPNVMSASEAEAVRAPSPASDERDDMDILASEQGDATHTVATQNEEDVDDDVPLL